MSIKPFLVCAVTLIGLCPPAATAAESAPASTEKTGILDHAFPIPGTTATIKFGGFVKVDFIVDLDPVGNVYEFKLNSIPIEGTPAAEQGGQTTISAKQSRFNIDFKSDATENAVRVFLEGDFFGSGDGGFRLRHAYGSWKGLLGGQTWTTFMDISARPTTLDFEGPDAEVFARQSLIRYTGRPSKQFEWAIAVENSSNDISSTGAIAGAGRSEWPDLPFHIRFQRARAHIQLAGIVRQLRFVSTDGTVDETATAYGLNLSGKVLLGASSEIMGLMSAGKGTSHYIDALNGTGSDAVVTPAGDLEALGVRAAMLGFTQHWTRRCSSTLTGAWAVVDNNTTQPATAIKAVSSGHLNLICSPHPYVELGGEVMSGERKNYNDEEGKAVRVLISLKFKLG